MIIKKIDNFQFNYFATLLLCLLPIALVLSRAVAELLVFIICCSFLYFSILNKKIISKYYNSIFFKLFLLFYLYLILNSSLSEYPLHSLKNSLFYFRFAILTLAIWYLNENYNKFKIYFFISILLTVAALIAGSLFQIFYHLFLYDKLHISFNKPYSNSYDASRISGLFGSWKVQGSFLVRILPIIIGIYFAEKFKFLSIKNFFLFILAIIILILLSGERAALFLLIMTLTVTFVFLKIDKYKKIFLIFFLVFFIIVTFSLSNPLRDRIFKNTIINIFDSGKVKIFSEGHQEHYISATRMFLSSPFLGKGVVNFRLECKKDIYKDIGPYHCTTHPHNTYIQLLAETGIIGFIFIFSIFFYFLIYIFKKFIFYYFNNRKINFSSICYATCILANLFPFIPTGNFFNNWLSILYFLPFGFFMSEIHN